MPANGQAVCELWDLTRPVLPPRSRLYHLEPIGLGTPAVESLTGYLARLAEAHCVSPRQLLLQEVVPLLGRPRLAKPVNGGLSAFWAKDARALNGMRTLARDGVRALESLTLRHDLRFLTLLPWAEGLTPAGVLRARRAWCPDCYTTWQTAQQPIYEPLLWALSVVEICPQHQRRLCWQCPHPLCRQPLAFLGPRARPGYCSKCQGWLGLGPETESGERAVLPADEQAWQTWLVNAIGEMLARGPSLSVPPRPPNLARVMRPYLQPARSGRAKRLAQALRASASTVSAWRAGGRRPQLDYLLRLCYHFDLSPVRLLTDDTLAINLTETQTRLLPEHLSNPKRQRRPFERQRIRQALETALASDEQPPPPMRTVARRVGYAPSFLHSYFPDLCRAISARYLAEAKARGQQRLQALCEQVRQAATTIHAEGSYPSATRISLRLSEPGFMRHPSAMATWRQTLRALGWNS